VTLATEKWMQICDYVVNMLAASSVLKLRELVKFLLCLGIHGEALKHQMRSHGNFNGKPVVYPELLVLELFSKVVSTCFYAAQLV